MVRKARTKLDKDERLVLGIAVGAALFLGVGCSVLMVALNQHEQSSALPGPTDEARPLSPDHARQLVDFSLTDRSGRQVTRADVAGKFLVVDFLFTSCSLTCPVVNSHMAEIQRLSAGQSDVKLISLTVDPRDDTTNVLADYGLKYGADLNRWWLLTGNQADLYHLIGTSFLSADLNDPFSYMPGNFSHTERIALVDPQGDVRAYFDGLSDNVATAVVAEIGRLRQ